MCSLRISVSGMMHPLCRNSLCLKCRFAGNRFSLENCFLKAFPIYSAFSIFCLSIDSAPYALLQDQDPYIQLEGKKAAAVLFICLLMYMLPSRVSSEVTFDVR